ncbi:SDR family NAD(P)-dependent oxidoreductase [Pseudonocardia xinjiangensis]|uniref:SDR family oxidoreductase n=1 Tax=Pseudonocardia xinjiangensis TaxID=75289 RepID=A0ABX1R977_9PSEU|nr:SDR family oxidoreductase [Pseudonocardia xinjiangensis]NMH76933.1 SDR family oxidoreductase [Pseudonocardia xinjiangensis]
MSGQLTGKVAVITGGTSGIGLGIARRFIAEGAQVFVTGRRKTQLDATADELGSQAVAVQCDVSDLADLDRLYDIVNERAGRIDVLVANAGDPTVAALGDITEEHFDASFATNVKGVVFGVQKAIPLLSSGASVILIGSTTSVRPDPGLEVYGATKAALRNFARSWTVNSKAHDFRVNVLSPGPTRIPALLGLAPVDEQAALLDRFAATVPLGRIGDPDEIAAAATFLASDAAGYVNGAEWFIDGGYAQV